MATQSYVQKVRSGRLVQPFGYAAGTVVTNPVTLRGPVYTEWYLRLRGTLTSSAAIAAANVNPGDEWAVVNRVRLLAGSEVLFDYTGEELKWWNYRMYGVPPRQGMAFGAGPTVIDSSLTIPFWDLRSAKPIEVAFNSGAYTTLTLEVTWGDETSISTLGTILANASLDVYYEGATGFPGPFLVSKATRQTFATIAANDQYDIPIETGTYSYTDFMLYAKDAGGVDAPGLIDNVQIISGSTVLQDLPVRTLLDRTFQRYAMREAVTDGVASKPFMSAGSVMDNWLMWGLLRDGRRTESLGTVGVSQLYMRLKVNSEITKLNLVSRYWIPGVQTVASV